MCMCACRYDIHTFFKDKIYIKFFSEETKRGNSTTYLNGE